MIAPLNPAIRLNHNEAANYLGVAPKTLSNWNSDGVGPTRIRVGGRCQYRVSDLDSFLAQKVQEPEAKPRPRPRVA